MNADRVEHSKRKGRSRSVFFLVTSLAFAGLVAFVIFGVIESFNQQLEVARQPAATVKVVVATQELPVGIEITEELVDVVRMAPATLPYAGWFDEADQVLGRTPRERVLPGEVLREARLASATAGIGLNVLVTPGMRAMTIETDSQSGVGGFLRPGYKVDCIVTIRPDENALKARWVTETILQDVTVLAVGRNLPGAQSEEEANRRARSVSRSRNYVTLQVDVEQAERLALASARGELHLALRSDIDLEKMADRGPLVTNEMVGLPKTRTRRPVRRKKPEVETAEVIAGDKKVIETFDDSGRKVSDSKKNR
jgi:pilus assembly protein CpaB